MPLHISDISFIFSRMDCDAPGRCPPCERPSPMTVHEMPVSPLDLRSVAVGPALRSRLEFWAGLIRTARKRRGWSLVRLAAEAQQQGAQALSKSTLSALETGHPDCNPDPQDLVILARTLGVPSDILGIVEPRSTLAKLVTELQRYPDELTAHLYGLLLSIHGPLLRDRSTPSPCTTAP